MGTISHIEIGGGKRPKPPSAADLRNGMTALRMCRAATDDLPRMVQASVIASLIAEFLALWPDNSRGEILRILNKHAHAALELITGEPPPDAPPDTAA